MTVICFSASVGISSPDDPTADEKGKPSPNRMQSDILRCVTTVRIYFAR